MIGLAAICWTIWKTWNNSCFEQKLISSPMEIVCLASSFLNYWAGLQAGQKQKEARTRRGGSPRDGAALPNPSSR